MRYFDFNEILSSGLAAFVFGGCFGFIAPLITVIFSYLEGFFAIIPRSIVLTRQINLKSISDIRKTLEKKNLKITLFFRDLIYVLLYGICYLLLLYIFCDGIPRIYMLIISLFSSFLTYRKIGIKCERALSSAISYVYAFIVLILAVFLKPIYFLYIKFISKRLKAIVAFLSKKASLLSVFIKEKTNIRRKKDKSSQT